MSKNTSPSSNGKGSARRREDLSKVRDNWDQIDWSKGRPAEKQHEIQFPTRDKQMIEKLKETRLTGGATDLCKPLET
jgi:hypothetical protein